MGFIDDMPAGTLDKIVENTRQECAKMSAEFVRIRLKADYPEEGLMTIKASLVVWKDLTPD